MSICPVCFWEDGPDWADELGGTLAGSNSVTLLEAQRSFAALGYIDASYRDSVRPALPEELRDPAWRSLDQQRAEALADVLATIERAFAGVSREGGVSLHQTRVADDYGGPKAARKSRLLDRDRRWQEVPFQDLEEVCGTGGMSFFDPIGWRYYIPAYMTWFLSGSYPWPSMAAESTLHCLDPRHPELHSYCEQRYDALDARQVAAVVKFLRFVAKFGPHCQSEAQSALGRYWEARSRR